MVIEADVTLKPRFKDLSSVFVLSSLCIYIHKSINVYGFLDSASL